MSTLFQELYPQSPVPCLAYNRFSVLLLNEWCSMKIFSDGLNDVFWVKIWPLTTDYNPLLSPPSHLILSSFGKSAVPFWLLPPSLSLPLPSSYLLLVVPLQLTTATSLFFMGSPVPATLLTCLAKGGAHRCCQNACSPLSCSLTSGVGRTRSVLALAQPQSQTRWVLRLSPKSMRRRVQCTSLLTCSSSMIYSEQILRQSQ